MPVVVIECGARLQHTITFANSATRMAKPADLTFVALDTKMPHTLDFDRANGGKNAHYMLR